ncbi:MAG: tetratricopeptide repeat protein, partial [Methanosarcina sp.]|nr:tetratricopeptide repeat protein [Methanosarcina sp.]
YKTVLKIDPHHLKTLFSLGRLYIQQGEYRRAFDCFTQIIQINEDNVEAWNNLGSIYEELGSIDYAIYAYSKSLTINNYQEEANFHIARLQFQYPGNTSNCDSKNYEEIRQRLRFVLSVNPRHFGARQLLETLEQTVIEHAR